MLVFLHWQLTQLGFSKLWSLWWKHIFNLELHCRFWRASAPSLPSRCDEQLLFTSFVKTPYLLTLPTSHSQIGNRIPLSTGGKLSWPQPPFAFIGIYLEYSSESEIPSTLHLRPSYPIVLLLRTTGTTNQSKLFRRYPLQIPKSVYVSNLKLVPILRNTQAFSFVFTHDIRKVTSN